MKSNNIQLPFSSSGAMSGLATIQTNPLPIDQIYGYAIQVVWTGTPNGSFKLQASCDAPGNTTQTSNGGPDHVTNWTDISGTAQVVSGIAGTFMWNINGAFYRYVRVSYTNTSSSGAVTVCQSIVKG